MSNTMNIDPKNLMLLALLGIGAYMLTTRKVSAQSVSGKNWSQSPTRAIQGGTTANSGGIGGTVADLLMGLVNRNGQTASPHPSSMEYYSRDNTAINVPDSGTDTWGELGI